MPTSRSLPAVMILALLALACLEGAVAEQVPLPPPTDEGMVFVAPGIADDFDPVREAVAAIKRETGRDYRVIVVDSEGREGGAGRVLPRIVDRWWEARTEGSGYDPAGDVTILLDLGDRSIAMDVPPSVLREAGIDLEGLERAVISKVFVPQAKDMQYAKGLAELVKATQRTIQDRIAAKARRVEQAKVFRTRTLPIGLASLAGAGLLGWLAYRRIQHAGRQAAAREKLAAFKQEVVALSDLLDAQRERHRMLPHADPDFKTPMTGMTRDTYDSVQEAIGRYRERWLSLMDVWERAEKRIEEESFLGTDASDDVLAMLDAADARPPLDEVAAACRSPLDALETSHELARELAAAVDDELAAARGRLDALAARGRSAARFEPLIAAAARGRELGGDELEADPVAARGRIEDAQATLARMVTQVEAVEATDDRRRLAIERAAEIARQVATRRSEGWLLKEPGADPDELLAAAEREASLAGESLDAADVEMAVAHLERSEAAVAEAAKLVESVVAARSRAEALLATLAARLEAIAAAGPAIAGDLGHLESHYAETAWEDLAGNPAQAEAAARRAAALVAEGRAEVDPGRQHYFRAVAILEEAERQADWAANCLEAIAARRRELDELVTTLPGLRQRVAGRIGELAKLLASRQTDRARANERCREAGRIVAAADELAAERRPAPRVVEQALRAAEAAAARGEEFAAEDDRLATQAAADLSEAEGLYRRAASWYAEGVKADVRGVEQALRTAREQLGQQRYEDAIHAAGEANERARLAYASATAEAERRRARRIAAQRQRQLEESFARMSRGVGPWVISLPSGGFTGPDPWRSSGSLPRGLGGGRSTGGSWSRDVAEVRW